MTVNTKYCENISKYTYLNNEDISFPVKPFISLSFKLPCAFGIRILSPLSSCSSMVVLFVTPRYNHFKPYKTYQLSEF